LDRFASSGRPAARAALGLDDETPVLLIVGYIAPLKGQREAIQTLIEVRRTYPSACLLIAGETKFVSPAAADDSVGYERELRELAETLATGAVRFLGERDDLPDLMAAADLVLAPSWREAFGRAVVEAMAAGVCVIATEEGGPTEYIEDGVNGILLPPHDPERWGRVATDLLSAPERRDAIGAAAQVTSRRFSPEVHADAVIALYKQVLDRS
jgi:glycosyltransferase involved in cell wall biosynthesis